MRGATSGRPDGISRRTVIRLGVAAAAIGLPLPAAVSTGACLAPLTLDMILKVVCYSCDITRAHLASGDRHANVAAARRYGIYLAAMHTNRPLAEIALRFGSRNAMTALLAARRVHRQTMTDSEVGMDILHLSYECVHRMELRGGAMDRLEARTVAAPTRARLGSPA